MCSTYSGLESLSIGQTEAGLSAGFSHTQILYLILLPQALRNLIPSFIGLFVSLIKDTSIAFIVNVPELTTVASQVNNHTQLYPMQIYVFIGFVYFILCRGFSLLAEWLGNRGKQAGYVS
jgi:polar amino acid transport system permease protein